MRIIVTGGSGFVGTNLVEHFTRLGWDVLNLDIAEPRNPSHIKYWKKVDLLDPDLLTRTLGDFEPQALLHMAARTDLSEKHDLRGYAANIEGVGNTIEAIKHTPSLEKVIFASSQLVCPIGYQPKDEWDVRPTTLYGQSKVLTERIIRAAGDFGASWTIVRPTSLWGPWFGEPYRNFFQAIAKNLYVHQGKISPRKQWGFVGNSVFQLHKLLDVAPELVHGRTFYLADYQAIDLREFANKVQRALGSKPIKTVPAPALKLVARIGDVLQVLGWKHPPLTSFRYNNIVTPELQDLKPLEGITGPLPYGEDEAVDVTVRWLQDHNVQASRSQALEPHRMG